MPKSITVKPTKVKPHTSSHALPGEQASQSKSSHEDSLPKRCDRRKETMRAETSERPPATNLRTNHITLFERPKGSQGSVRRVWRC